MQTCEMPQEARTASDSLYRLIRSRVAREGDAGDLEATIVLTRVVAEMIIRQWTGFLGRLNAGLDAEKARTDGAVYSAAAATLVDAERILQEEGARRAREANEHVRGLPELAEVARAVEAIREAAREVVNTMNRAGEATPDLAEMERAEAELDAGKVRKGKDLIARLRTGKAS